LEDPVARFTADGIALSADESAGLAKRDRVVDFVRGASILVVVVGHWLMAVLVWDANSLAVDNVLARIDGLWPATWLLQVMPLFFFVGGFSNLKSINSARGRDEPYAVWLERRVRRIMRPTAFFLAIAVPAVAAFELTAGGSLGAPAVLLTQLFWFLGVYLGVIALTPAMLSFHRRTGVTVLVALVAVAAVGDLLRFSTGEGLLGILNFAAVWLFAQQLGFFYAEDRISRRAASAMVLGGLLALAGLVLLGPYPSSMVGLPGEPSNMNPPTLAIVAVAVWQAGLILLLRPALNRWLRRPWPWTGVVGVNSAIMTILLWHLPLLLIVGRILYPLGVPQPQVGTAIWWLMQPPTIAVLAAGLAGTVVLFRRFEQVPPGLPAAPSPKAGATAGLGVVLLIAGVLGFSLTGPAEFFRTDGVNFIVFSVSPALSVLHLVLGGLLVRDANRGTGAMERTLTGTAVSLIVLAGLGLLAMNHVVPNRLAINAADVALHVTLAVAALVILSRSRNRVRASSAC
jgi:fucose 4-O-acetylase-like acetyltransferase